MSSIAAPRVAVNVSVIQTTLGATIVTLAYSFGLAVLGEGVETEERARALGSTVGLL